MGNFRGVHSLPCAVRLTVGSPYPISYFMKEMSTARTPPSGARSRGGSLDVGSRDGPLGSTYSVAGALESVRGGRGDGCGGCKKVVGEKQRGIECDVCGVWYHVKCGGLTPRDYDFFSGGEETWWACGACKRKIKSDDVRMKELEDENNNLRVENSRLVEKIDEIKGMIREMKVEIKREIKEEIRSGMKEEITKEIKLELQEGTQSGVAGMEKGSQEKVMSDIRRDVLEKMREEDEKRRRECNVVIHGITEGNDREVVRDIFKEKLRVNDVVIEEIVRLGRGRGERGDGKPVPLLVKLGTPGQKWAIVGRAKNLRNAGDDYRRVMIVPDLTVKEREEDKRLREELRGRRDAGEVDLIINKGRVIRRSTGGTGGN